MYYHVKKRQMAKRKTKNVILFIIFVLHFLPWYEHKKLEKTIKWAKMSLILFEKIRKQWIFKFFYWFFKKSVKISSSRHSFGDCALIFFDIVGAITKLPLSTRGSICWKAKNNKNMVLFDVVVQSIFSKLPMSIFDLMSKQPIHHFPRDLTSICFSTTKTLVLIFSAETQFII